LTILGIVIGITSIIMVMSLGQGAQDLILGQVQGMGSKTIIVVPGRQPKGPSDVAQALSDSLKERDFIAISNIANVPTARRVMPIVMGAASAAYGSDTYRLTIFGGGSAMAELFSLTTETGTFFTDEEVRGKQEVAVIGSKVKTELFGDGDAIGERIRIKGRNFRIVGVLTEQGSGSFVNFDEVALMPYTTAQQYVFGIKYFHRLFIEADTEADIARTVADIQVTLRSTHNIDNPDKDDFFVETQADIAERIGTITTALTLFLAAMASISLIVGGIGIMNIMLVSVTERTREIGLRKAIGATYRNILTQFLTEAVVLTSVGGAIGIALGAGLSFIASLILTQVVGSGWHFTFPIQAAVLGFGTAAFVGLIFGIYPARQAAKKSPMEALRYE
jgi:putative ABC transport system permease protein